MSGWRTWPRCNPRVTAAKSRRIFQAGQIHSSNPEEAFFFSDSNRISFSQSICPQIFFLFFHWSWLNGFSHPTVVVLEECAEIGRKYDVFAWALRLHLMVLVIINQLFSGSVKCSYYNQANTKTFSDNMVWPGKYIICIWIEIKWRSTAWRSSCAETNNTSGWRLMKHFLP